MFFMPRVASIKLCQALFGAARYFAELSSNIGIHEHKYVGTPKLCLHVVVSLGAGASLSRSSV